MGIVTEILTEGVGRWGLVLPDAQMALFEKYFSILARENEAVNLTALVTERDVALRHFLDSMCPPAQALLPRGAALIDVGSGGGFPGIPLAIVRPDLAVTLLEARQKKVDFLRTATAELALGNVTVLWGRAEDLARDCAHRERYGAAAARAVAPLNVLAEYLLPFVRVGGVMLAWKGPTAPEELAAAGSAIRRLGGDRPVLRPYAINDEFCNMQLVTCDKLRPTSAAYPRKAGKPAKEPLI